MGTCVCGDSAVPTLPKGRLAEYVITRVTAMKIFVVLFIKVKGL